MTDTEKIELVDLVIWLTTENAARKEFCGIVISRGDLHVDFMYCDSSGIPESRVHRVDCQTHIDTLRSARDYAVTELGWE